MHKILSFVGVVVGSFIVLITPSLVHYKVVADTKYSKVINIMVIIYAVTFAIVLGSLILYFWNKPNNKF